MGYGLQPLLLLAFGSGLVFLHRTDPCVSSYILCPFSLNHLMVAHLLTATIQHW